jgi:hypothetical protein
MKKMEKKFKSIDEESPDHFQFLRAAINVVWVYNAMLGPIQVDRHTFTTLMREARSRVDLLQEEYDELKEKADRSEKVKPKKLKRAA